LHTGSNPGSSGKSMLFSDSMRQLIQQHQQQEAAEQQQQQQQLGSSSEPVQQQHMPGRQQQQQQAGLGSPLHPSRPAKISNRQRLVEQTFKQLFKDELHTVIPVRNFQAVDELLRQWNTDLQAYIQGRALLQLRLDRAAKAGAASGSGGVGCCGGSSARSSETAGDLQQQQHSAAGDVEAGYLPTAGAMHSSSGGSSSPQQRPAAVVGLRVRTSSISEGGSSLEPRGAASLSVAGSVSANHSADGASAAAAASADVGLADEPCCRTPRLAPLKPRPVLPDEVAKGLKPRLVSKDEEKGATAMGRCCARLAGALFGGPGAEDEEEAAQDDVGTVAERLEVQRQALVDLEASILEAQKEVRCWLGPVSAMYIGIVWDVE
jgi:hypothetical protein